jgi:outer membrane protein OmpA-like peptidoglycan-associated protein
MKKKYIIILLASLSFLIFNFELYSKTFNINYLPDDIFQLVAKSNIRLYLNNKYIGLQSNEIKGILRINNLINSKSDVSGDVYFYHKTIRGESRIGNEIDKTEKCSFNIDNQGIVSDATNPLFPPVQNIPFFTLKNINIGDVYESKGIAGIELYDSDKSDSAEIIIKMEYSGQKEYLVQKYDYFKISFTFDKMITQNNIKKASGKHELELYFDSAAGKPVFMRENVTDNLELLNSDNIRREGFRLYFYKTITPMNKNQVIKDLTSDINKELMKDLTIKKKEQGVSITINNLKFKADSTELLDSEIMKIDELALMLTKIKNRSFLIIGHTAKSGTEDEQMKLSLERAKIVSDFLIKKGMPQDILFCQGKGSKEPVAPNDSEENMQKNRRVEIIILEN